MPDVLSKKALGERLALGEPLQGLYLAGGDYRGLDFSGARLERVDGRRADFSGCHFSNSLWRDCWLQHATFREVRGQNWRLEGCDGNGVDCSGAQLLDWQLVDCRLNGLILLRSRLERAAFSTSDLSALCAQQAHWKGVRAFECQLWASQFGDADLQDCAFEKTALEHAFFSGATADGCSFWRSQGESVCFVDAQLRGAIFAESQFDRADFSGAQLVRANLRYARWPDCRLLGSRLDYADASHWSALAANLTDASMLGTRLHRADLDQAFWQGRERQRAQAPDEPLLAAEDWQPGAPL